ncbi:MAG: hypothetical protein ABFE07_02360 [Armatimonadia bacterium]
MKRLALSLVVLATTTAFAVELVQVTPPASTTLSLYPGQTRALVRETRPVTLAAGETTLSFSWTSPAIDPASVTLALAEAGVGDAVRAGDGKLLQWKVTSPQARQAEATVSYSLEGCKWVPLYQASLSADGRASLRGFVQVTNDSGAALKNVRVQVAISGPGMIDATEPSAAAKLYAVEEPISLSPGETITRPFLQMEALPATQRYVYQADAYAGKVERLLTLNLPDQLRNLPEGALTVYGPDDGGIPLFRTQLTYQPGQELEMDLGPEPDVIVERKLMATQRTNIETDRFGRVSGSDTTEEYLITARNRTGCDLNLEVIEMLLSTWELRSLPAVARVELNQALFSLPVTANGAAELKMTLIKHSGTRVKK